MSPNEGKLGILASKGAEAQERRNGRVPGAQPKPSCRVQISQFTFWALVDTGADVSLLSSETFRMLSRGTGGTQLDTSRVSLKSSKLNKQQTADTINDYFANIGLNLASNIPHGPTTLCRVTQPPADIFNLQPVTEDQVKKQLKMLATHKSSGITELSTTFIKDSLMILSKEFTYIINQILTTGISPIPGK